MTDKKLLELAAKAAGIDVRCISNGEQDEQFSFYTQPDQLWWNPLEDDGDALRLAVKLRILVDPDGDTYAVSTAVPKGRGEYMVSEAHRSDPYAATRSAIVRAAAKIGRQM